MGTKEIEMTDETFQRFESQRRSLYAVAGMGQVDAFEWSVRRLEARTIARMLRSVAGDPEYTLGKLDPDLVRQIADEIEH